LPLNAEGTMSISAIKALDRIWEIKEVIKSEFLFKAIL
jgi:hypothetical protein